METPIRERIAAHVHSKMCRIKGKDFAPTAEQMDTAIEEFLQEVFEPRYFLLGIIAVEKYEERPSSVPFKRYMMHLIGGRGSDYDVVKYDPMTMQIHDYALAADGWTAVKEITKEEYDFLS